MVISQSVLIQFPTRKGVYQNVSFFQFFQYVVSGHYCIILCDEKSHFFF